MKYFKKMYRFVSRLIDVVMYGEKYSKDEIFSIQSTITEVSLFLAKDQDVLIKKTKEDMFKVLSKDVLNALGPTFTITEDGVTGRTTLKLSVRVKR